MMGTDPFFGVGIADHILFRIPILHSLSDPDPRLRTQPRSGSPINDRDPAHH